MGLSLPDLLLCPHSSNDWWSVVGLGSVSCWGSDFFNKGIFELGPEGHGGFHQMAAEGRASQQPLDQQGKGRRWE